MFSSSFVISAASGVETRTTSSQTSPYSSSARSAHASVSPPTTFGVLRSVKSVRPGIDALGREREVEVAPGGEPGLLQQRRDPLARGARVGRRLEHDQLARLQHARRARAARPSAGRGPARGCASAASARRSAPRRALASARVARRRVRSRARPRELLRRRRPRCRTRPAPIASILRASTSTRDDVAALLGERHRERQPDVAEADDADVLIARQSRRTGQGCRQPVQPALGDLRRLASSCSSRRSACTMRSTSASKPRRLPAESRARLARVADARGPLGCPHERRIHPM